MSIVKCKKEAHLSLSSWGVQYMYSVMHKLFIMVKIGEAKETKIKPKNVNLPKLVEHN